MPRKLPPILMEKLEPRVFLDASQLTMAIDSITLPASVSDRSALTGKVSLTVSNNSGITQKQNVVVSCVISNGPLNVFTPNFAVLKSTKTLLSLADGQSKTFTLSISVAKGKIADGTFIVSGLVVDPTNTFTNVVGPTLTVRPPIVVLSETENILKLPDSTAAGSKVTVTDQVSITNNGSDPSTDPIKIGLYATPDGIPANGSLVTSINRTVTIKPGQTVMLPVTIGGIPALSVGTYKLVTQVTQANGTVTTTDPLTAPTVTITKPTSGIHFIPTINTHTPTYTPEPLDGATKFLSSLTMQMSIKNTGTAANGEDQFDLFASNSSTFDNTAMEIGSTLTLDLGLIPHNGLRIFNIDFNTIDLNDFSAQERDRFIFVKVTDPTGNVSLASLGTPLEVSGPIV